MASGSGVQVVRATNGVETRIVRDTVPLTAGAIAGLGTAATHDATDFVPKLATAPDHTVSPAYIDTTTSPPTLKVWNGSAWVAGGVTAVTTAFGTTLYMNGVEL